MTGWLLQLEQDTRLQATPMTPLAGVSLNCQSAFEIFVSVNPEQSHKQHDLRYRTTETRKQMRRYVVLKLYFANLCEDLSKRNNHKSRFAAFLSLCCLSAGFKDVLVVLMKVLVGYGTLSTGEY